MKTFNQRVALVFGLTLVATFGLFTYALTHGSITISVDQLYRGLFIAYDQQVAIIYDLRFPRIIIALFGGAALAVSGTMLQATMKNPMADPGFMGISSAAALAGSATLVFFPTLYHLLPLFSVLGGVLAYIILYALVWQEGIQPLKLVLVGVALNMMFIGMGETLKIFTRGRLSQAQSIIAGNVAQKTWADVQLIGIYVTVLLIVALFTIRMCNILELDDKVARSIGVNVDRYRFIVAMISVLLASVTTATLGIVAFVGLIVPHTARVLVGGNHKVLMPYVALLGAFVLLLSDTVGRIVAYPYEISAAVIMSVVGGPFFVLILKIWGKRYAD